MSEEKKTDRTDKLISPDDLKDVSGGIGDLPHCEGCGRVMSFGEFQKSPLCDACRKLKTEGI